MSEVIPEDVKQLASSTFMRITSFSPRTELGGIEREWIESRIASVIIEERAKVRYQPIWYSLEELKSSGLKIEIGKEFLGYSPEWVDEDYNIDGIRVCFLNEDDNGPWISTYWNNYQDFYATDDSTSPTHIMNIPKNHL